MILCIAMVDWIRHQGPPFTWHNKREHSYFERLDRALSSQAWLHPYKDAVVEHMTIGSNHGLLFCTKNPKEGTVESFFLSRDRWFLQDSFYSPITYKWILLLEDLKLFNFVGKIDLTKRKIYIGRNMNKNPLLSYWSKEKYEPKKIIQEGTERTYILLKELKHIQIRIMKNPLDQFLKENMKLDAKLRNIW